MNRKFEYVKSLSERLLEGSIAKTENGIRLFRPDGMGRYPAVWTRDFTYMVEYAGELMADDDIYFNIDYILDHVSSEGYIPDWVRPCGMTRYGFIRPEFPETPLLDNGSFIIVAADLYLDRLDDESARRVFAKWRDALCGGIDWLPVNENGIIEISEDALHVGYGFTDTVKKSGQMAMETLLLWRAAKLLSRRLALYGQPSEKYEGLIAKIEENFLPTFTSESGMIYSTTGLCSQIDVWASCYMISIGFPVGDAQRSAIAKWLAENYDGVVQDGQIRHLPKGEYWEATYLDIEKDTYQNGAFWAVATTWFYDAIKDAYPDLAKKCVLDVLDYFEKNGAYECICGEYKKLDTYVVSATSVYDATKKIMNN